jgi:hypothetical protein
MWLARHILILSRPELVQNARKMRTGTAPLATLYGRSLRALRFRVEAAALYHALRNRKRFASSSFSIASIDRWAVCSAVPAPRDVFLRVQPTTWCHPSPSVPPSRGKWWLKTCLRKLMAKLLVARSVVTVMSTSDSLLKRSSTPVSTAAQQFHNGFPVNDLGPLLACHRRVCLLYIRRSSIYGLQM